MSIVVKRANDTHYFPLIISVDTWDFWVAFRAADDLHCKNFLSASVHVGKVDDYASNLHGAKITTVKD